MCSNRHPTLTILFSPVINIIQSNPFQFTPLLNESHHVAIHV